MSDFLGDFSRILAEAMSGGVENADALLPVSSREERRQSADRGTRTAQGGPCLMPKENSQERGAESVAEVRARFGGEAPLIAQDVPDWNVFCKEYAERRCGLNGCRHYRRDAPCWCIWWETVFPNVVRWYPCE